jgi:peptidoglycan glycosyltransferase
VAAAGIAAASGYERLAGELKVDLEALKAVDRRELFQTTRITDRNGVVLYEIFDEGRRTPVPLARIPKHLRDATIATEDATFYTNPGFELLSIARAAAQNMAGGRIASGASWALRDFASQTGGAAGRYSAP